LFKKLYYTAYPSSNLYHITLFTIFLYLCPVIENRRHLNTQHIDLISAALGIKTSQISKTIELLDEGATLPFIARYRKEVTGGLDEVQIADIQKNYKKLNELVERKESIISSIEEQGKLTPELREKILNSYDANEIEDLYAPYKRKKKTRADVAREQGLEPLAKLIMSQKGQNITLIAQRYINGNITNVTDAINGAQDIIAEWISENITTRERLRETFRRNAEISSKVNLKKKEEAQKFEDYFEFSEKLSKCPSHRFLAMQRGESEGMLRLSLQIDDERALENIKRIYIKSHSEEADIIEHAIEDSYKRLLIPSIENQIFSEFKEKADDEAIRVFSENLRQLLLSPPLGQKSVLALDPGFRTGCKIVCLDDNGELIYNDTIYPHAPQNQWAEAQDKIRFWVDKYRIEAIAIGNGTASRESKDLVESIKFDSQIQIFMVSENGASIYSASDVAREEFPHHDVTVRGSISIGRRLMDPLAELVKIDPKSIGVGQYQHDVHQGKLKQSLDMTVMSSVNQVGVNLNTASHHLLTYVAGLGPSLAKNIVEYRRNNGDFKEIKTLMAVPRLGAKAFEQAAGFLRITNGLNPLDNTGVHPESYPTVEKMAKDVGCDVSTLIASKEVRSKVNINKYVTPKVGLPTLNDILADIEKLGLDPRGAAKVFDFDERIKSISDVNEEMVLPAIVTNLTKFGAFVDIGAKQDGLLHISQISRKFIQDPSEVLKLGQELKVKVISVDKERKRINLTLLF